MNLSVLSLALLLISTTGNNMVAAYYESVPSGDFAYCPVEMGVTQICYGGESGNCGSPFTSDTSAGIECDCLPNAGDNCDPDAITPTLRENSDAILWQTSSCLDDQVAVALCLSQEDEECYYPNAPDEDPVKKLIGCAYAGAGRGTSGTEDLEKDGGKFTSTCLKNEDDGSPSFISVYSWMVVISTNVVFECSQYDQMIVDATPAEYSLCPVDYAATGLRYGGTNNSYFGPLLTSNSRLSCDCMKDECPDTVEPRSVDDADIIWEVAGNDEFAKCSETQSVVALCISDRDESNPGYCQVPNGDGKFYQTIVGCVEDGATGTRTYSDDKTAVDKCDDGDFLWAVKTQYKTSEGESICQSYATL